jgi:hypothetical protein
MLTFSCSGKVMLPDPTDQFNKKVDSILLHFKRTNPLISQIGYLDTANPQKSFPLLKTVKYENIECSFQFRQAQDCHEQLEIFICYNDTLMAGIPFTDNYYYNKDDYNSARYQDKLSFENELNKAIGIFSNSYYKTDSLYDSYFAECFVQAIMDNMTKYRNRMVYTYLDDFAFIKKDTRQFLSNNILTRSKCRLNALKNIDKLEKEMSDPTKNITAYYLYSTHCIYAFKFHEHPQDGKYVSVNVINKECYFCWIF